MSQSETQPAGARLINFVDRFGALMDERLAESEILARGGLLLADLVRDDNWLPETYAEPDAELYRQYLLYLDPRERFSIVSFVWGPGQATPVHDHRVWGLIGVLRGAEVSEAFARDYDGVLRPSGPARTLHAGEVEAVSPRIGDIHRVTNAHNDRVSISVHVYGSDIGKVERATYTLDGRAKPFVSGYHSRSVLLP